MTPAHYLFLGTLTYYPHPLRWRVRVFWGTRTGRWQVVDGRGQVRPASVFVGVFIKEG